MHVPALLPRADALCRGTYHHWETDSRLFQYRNDKLKDTGEVEHSLAGVLRCVLSLHCFLFSVAEADAPVKSGRQFGFQSSNMYSVFFLL